MATANPNRIQAHNIPIRFHPFAADGSKPPALITAFLKDHVAYHEWLTKEHIIYQNKVWEIILDNPVEILNNSKPTHLTEDSISHPLLEVIISFQEWRIQFRDNDAVYKPIARIAIIRQRKDR